MDRMVERSIPEDAVPVVMAGNDWIIYYSAFTNLFYVYPTSYHPEALALSRNILEKMLREITGRAGVGGEEGDRVYQ